LQPLRRALARDIEHLKGLPQVDVPGIARRLETLLEQTDALPLAFASELAENTPSNRALQGEANGEPSPMNFITDLARDVWREVKSLVRIERLDQAELPVLLAPAQSTFLRENLKIRLLTARLALLARDGRTYAADLAQSRTWVERFFDVRDAHVQDVLAELEALQAMPIKVEQAGPTESFAALRLLQARASSGAVSSGTAAPQPANGQR
jgi:uroporphyrin-3 C-methyltransferase